MKQDIIKFNSYFIDKFSMQKKENIEKEKQGTLNLKCDYYHNEDSKNNLGDYCVLMELKVFSKFSEIDIVAKGFFEISSKLGDDDKEYFLNISAPSIIYPYIRAFISNVTSFDTNDIVILPIIDFASKDID